MKMIAFILNRINTKLFFIKNLDKNSNIKILLNTN